MAEKTWESLIRKWWGRLVRDPDWDIRVIGNPMLEDEAKTEIRSQYKQAVFYYYPDAVPSDTTACHEVLHVVLHPYVHMADTLAKAANDSHTAYLIERAEDAAVHTLALALVRAYERR